MPCGCHGRDARLSHGRLAWHHFFPEWLASLRFISGKKDPTLPALRPSSRGLRPGRFFERIYANPTTSVAEPAGGAFIEGSKADRRELPSSGIKT